MLHSQSLILTSAFRTNLLLVVLYAIAMAWAESATVVYLRTVVDRMEPYQSNPLPRAGNLETTELVREAATLIMIATVGWLAGQSRKRASAYALVIFGTWDIFYYLFLKLLVGWPRSLLDWDVLFLIPLPWWGPALAPMLIALLMIACGIVMLELERAGLNGWPSRFSLVVNNLGIALALAVFMKDALAAANQGPDAIRAIVPVSFPWPLFLLAWALMAVPLFELLGRKFRMQNGED